MSKVKKKKKIVIGSIIGVVLLLGAVLAFQVLGNGNTNQYTEENPVVQNIVNDSRFTGVIESQSREDVMTGQAMDIYDLYVSEGDQVEKDTDLYQTYAGATVSATVSGEVSKIYYEVDDTVPAGGKVMDVVDYTNLQVKIKVDEYELANVQVGTPVTINVDSIGRNVEGVVSEVSREAINENDVSYFTAIIDFQGDVETRIGMNAEVIIVKASAENALTVPVEAIHFTANNDPLVLIKNESGKMEERNVTTGITDGSRIEITGGLTDTDLMMIPITITPAATSSQGPPSGFGGGN
ncbi:MAG: efflux RND transporter periplasmic adaptor subunit [Acetobacterium sp.]